MELATWYIFKNLMGFEDPEVKKEKQHQKNKIISFPQDSVLKVRRNVDIPWAPLDVKICIWLQFRPQRWSSQGLCIRSDSADGRKNVTGLRRSAFASILGPRL